MSMPAEATALRICFDKLVTVIDNPTKIAAKFFSNGLISREVLQYVTETLGLPPTQKKSQLLLAVIAQVEVSPEKFSSVVKLFEEEPTLVEITAQLVRTRKILTGEISPVTSAVSQIPLPTPGPCLQSSTPPLRQIPTPVSPFAESSSIAGSRIPLPIPSYMQSSPPILSQIPTPVSPFAESSSIAASQIPISFPQSVQSFPPAFSQIPTPVSPFAGSSSIAGSQIPISFPQSFPPAGSQVQTPISRYASCLRDKYKCQPATKPWPPSPCEEIILPVFTEKRVGPSQSEPCLDRFEQLPMCIDKRPAAQDITFGEILKKDGLNLKCVLVEGAPGIGKSVFAWKLCQEWVEGKLFKEYDLVVQLKMDEKNVQEAKKIGDLFEHDDSELQEQVTKEVIRRDGEGVLLIFEALDELPSMKLITNRGSVFRDIFRGSKISKANLVITCRPWAATPLQQVCKVSRHLELLGFTDDGISQYISCAFSNERERAEFEEYLSLWSFAKTMMNIPLITAIVVQVYRSHKKMQDQPRTLTELYTALVMALLRTHIEDHSEEVECDEDLKDLESFPSPIHDQFHYLCELAYTGISKRADGGEEIRNFPKSSLPKDFNPAGLMKSTTNLYADRGTIFSYSFHSTLQEFLAAYHLSLQTEEDQKVYFKKHSLTCQSDVTVGFLCGLSKFSTTLLQSLELPATSEKSKTNHLSMGSKLCYLRWLYEAQNPKVCSTFLKAKHIDFIPDCPLTPSDLFVLGYCVYYSHSSWKLDLTFSSFRPDSATMLSKFPISAGHFPDSSQSSPSGCLSSLKMTNKEYTDQAFCLLLSVPPRMLHGLTELDLEDNPEITSVSCRQLAKCISENVIPALKSLKLGSTSLGNGESVSLLEALASVHNFQVLSLTGTGIGPKDADKLAFLLSYHRLRELYIKENPLMSSSLEVVIALSLDQNSSLQILDVSGIPFSLETTDFLGLALETNCSLRQLYLANCEIDCHKAKILSQHLKQSRLQKLYMPANQVGTEGARALQEMLQENHSLKKLHLVDRSVDKKGAYDLIAALDSNKDVHLYLDEQCCPPDFRCTYSITDSARIRCHFVQGFMY